MLASARLVNIFQAMVMNVNHLVGTINTFLRIAISASVPADRIAMSLLVRGNVSLHVLWVNISQ